MELTGAVTAVVVGFVVAAASIGLVVGMFNRLVQVRNNADKAFKNIDVLLEQRHDELPKLVDACSAYMKHERTVLDRIIQLRTGYSQARGVEQKVGIENALAQALSQLRIVWEQYPDLKAMQAFTQINTRISELESEIADRRELFNDAVNIHNIQIERFPDLLVARLFGYRRRSFLEVPEHKKQDVALQFG